VLCSPLLPWKKIWKLTEINTLKKKLQNYDERVMVVGKHEINTLIVVYEYTKFMFNFCYEKSMYLA
jgi:hypothetical protein